jgi:hypothetical protein
MISEHSSAPSSLQNDMLTQEQAQLMAILRSLINLSKDEALQAVCLFQTHTLKRGEFSFVQVMFPKPSDS